MLDNIRADDRHLLTAVELCCGHRPATFHAPVARNEIIAVYSRDEARPISVSRDELYRTRQQRRSNLDATYLAPDGQRVVLGERMRRPSAKPSSARNLRSRLDQQQIGSERADLFRDIG